MRGLLFLVLAIGLGVATAPTARAEYYFAYSTWAKLSAEDRGLYASGVVDYLSTYENQEFATHFADCLMKNGMTRSQLGANVLVWAAPYSDLHTRPAAVVVMFYLQEICGRP